MGNRRSAGGVRILSGTAGVGIHATQNGYRRISVIQESASQLPEL
jgi:hypothetical protein